MIAPQTSISLSLPNRPAMPMNLASNPRRLRPPGVDPASTVPTTQGDSSSVSPDHQSPIRLDRRRSQPKSEQVKQLIEHLDELRAFLAEADKARTPRASQVTPQPNIPRGPRHDVLNMNAIFCPCVVHGHTTERLNYLDHGQSALDLKTEGFSPDCLLCFSSLRTLALK